MDITSVEIVDIDEEGLVESFLVNGDTTVVNGEDILHIEAVRQWLQDNNKEVPEYSSVRIGSE